jgi:outer membrane protein assembly factor BamD (BamD/ComL family)
MIRLPQKVSILLLGSLFFNLGAITQAKEEEAAVKLYQRGMKLTADGDLDAALDRFNTIATRYRRSETCAQALWEIYRIKEHQGESQGAFEALNRLATEQPGHFEKAHAAQFRLVQRLLTTTTNTKRTLDAERAPEKTSPDIIIAMLKAVIQNGTASEVGIRAQYLMGVALERADKKSEAIETHEDFAENNPKHELADDASYQVAYIRYKDWRAMRGDSPHQREAAALSLTWFITRFPESEKAAQARSCLREVKDAEQRELITLARYYESRGNNKAAATYYQQLGLQFPELLSQSNQLQDKIRDAMIRHNDGAGR